MGRTRLGCQQNYSVSPPTTTPPSVRVGLETTSRPRSHRRGPLSVVGKGWCAQSSEDLTTVTTPHRSETVGPPFAEEEQILSDDTTVHGPRGPILGHRGRRPHYKDPESQYGPNSVPRTLTPTSRTRHEGTSSSGSPPDSAHSGHHVQTHSTLKDGRYATRTPRPKRVVYRKFHCTKTRRGHTTSVPVRKWHGFHYSELTLVSETTPSSGVY